jgi:hypothetical protein
MRRESYMLKCASARKGTFTKRHTAGSSCNISLPCPEIGHVLHSRLIRYRLIKHIHVITPWFSFVIGDRSGCPLQQGVGVRLSKECQLTGVLESLWLERVMDHQLLRNLSLTTKIYPTYFKIQDLGRNSSSDRQVQRKPACPVHSSQKLHYQYRTRQNLVSKKRW